MEVREGLRFWKAWLAKGWEMEVMGGLCFWKPWMGIQYGAVFCVYEATVHMPDGAMFSEPIDEEHVG
ncbi:hypothetical protein RHGRI_016924 [Rhododendron griersonianum]|uniref:Uncharacterized protein n=1 Tax=Rhododendron griersonianum TaxID=479676 RepID=A0AAV6JVZ4_9ERIC|nr:hypothetical protein RHGRI_016924 [Rhododendron griersonianum]